MTILRTLLTFDVSSISLSIPGREGAPERLPGCLPRAARWTGELQAYDVTTAWAENTATWKTPWVKPGGDYAEPAVGGAAIDRNMVGKWITIDVTPLVAKWVADPTSNHGLMLRLRKVSSITGYRFVELGELGADEQRPSWKCPT